eukprot:12766048-Prorocentrum_lima.AAC.1
MTSSLVGSEMCIRDRPTTLQDWSSWSMTSDGWHMVCKHNNHEPPRFAVSYTHLTLPTICSV